MAHKFDVGQFVELLAPDISTSKMKSDSRYEITRRMPEDQAGIVSYRLKSASGERVARETDLAEVDGTTA